MIAVIDTDNAILTVEVSSEHTPHTDIKSHLTILDPLRKCCNGEYYFKGLEKLRKESHSFLQLELVVTTNFMEGESIK